MVIELSWVIFIVYRITPGSLHHWVRQESTFTNVITLYLKHSKREVPYTVTEKKNYKFYKSYKSVNGPEINKCCAP